MEEEKMFTGAPTAPEKEIKDENMERIFDKAVEYAQENYVDDSKGLPAMLLGDVAELIKMVTGKEVNVNTLTKYAKGKLGDKNEE